MSNYKIYGGANIESGTIDQFMDAMAQPFVVRGALMPDAHLGYGLPIGGVVATRGVVVPAWVGYDIGCGMCAMPTGFDPTDVAMEADEIRAAILERVPVGFAHRGTPLTEAKQLDTDSLTPTGREIYAAKQGDLQLGTLGGGNHFIEVGVDSDGRVWVVIHSGSRGVGHGLATHYMKLASGDGKAREGHYSLDADSQDGRDYLLDQAWCLKYALLNRRLMLAQVVAAIGSWCAGRIDERLIINRNHNHCEPRHNSRGMINYVHRKGATHAELGMMGVIPGNMRDGSYIVRGLGNEDSLCSSSHGAGRTCSRKQARQETSLEEFAQMMDGIAADVDDARLDENPTAYKPIDLVMVAQRDLVRVVTRVRPILNVKG